MLSKSEVIEGLRKYNEWRRGADIEMMNPTEIGEVIDTAISMLEDLDLQWADGTIMLLWV